ncbi:MAG: hypothetical protein KJ954_14320 [Alphaproteobacteria bacterium]|nr:hypothetical protein [Alphaproteobacteria bacterium]
MFYSWPIAVAAGNVESNKASIDMPMSSGVIHQVDIVFPDTADNDIRVQIFDASFQLWPSNRDGTVRGDAAVISFRDFYEMEAANNTLRGVAWLTNVAKACTIWIQIGVLPRSILQPFSLAELLRAVQRS